jgi:hypothetical protein
MASGADHLAHETDTQGWGVRRKMCKRLLSLARRQAFVCAPSYKMPIPVRPGAVSGLSEVREGRQGNEKQGFGYIVRPLGRAVRFGHEDPLCLAGSVAVIAKNAPCEK